MEVKCPYCGAIHTAAPGDFGSSVKCLGCSRQFTINHGYICAKDGTVSWFDSNQLAKMNECASAGVWVILVGLVFLVWSDFAVDSSEKSEMGRAFTDIEFIIESILVFAINLIICLKTWQGIVGSILSVTGLLMLFGSKTRCPNCGKHDGLMDLNSPMGWKMYLDFHHGELKREDAHEGPTVLLRRKHLIPNADKQVEIADRPISSPLNISASYDNIIKYVNLVLNNGLMYGASEIRVTKLGDEFCIKYVIEGWTKDGESPDARYAKSIIARIKSLAGLNSLKKDVAEQKGFIRLTYQGIPITFEVTYCSFCDGDESVVLKIFKNQKVERS